MSSKIFSSELKCKKYKNKVQCDKTCKKRNKRKRGVGAASGIIGRKAKELAVRNPHSVHYSYLLSPPITIASGPRGRRRPQSSSTTPELVLLLYSPISLPCSSLQSAVLPPFQPPEARHQPLSTTIALILPPKVHAIFSAISRPRFHMFQFGYLIE